MKLLQYPTLYFDESYRGYLWRLAVSNGFKSPYLLIKAFSSTFGCVLTWEELLQQSLWKDDFNVLMARGDRCNGRYIVRREFRVCPECLKKNVYLKEVWDYALLPWCLEHQCALVPVKEVFRYVFSREVLSGSRGKIKNIGALDLAMIIGGKLGFSVEKNKRTHLEVVERLSAAQLQRLVLLLGSYLRYPERFQPRKAAIKTDIVAATEIVTGAYEVLSDWPTSMEKMHELNQLGTHTTRRISNSLGYLYTAIHKELSSPVFDIIVSEFDKYLVRHWPNIIDSKSPWLNSLITGYSNYESGTTFSARDHISLNRLTGWIEAGLVDGAVHTLESGSRQITVKRGQNKKVEGLLSTLTLKEASPILGLPKECLRALITSGYILATQPKPGAAWMIEIRAIDEFLERLMVGSEPQQSVDGYLELNKLMRFYSCKQHTQADLLMAMLRKPLRFIIKRENKQILLKHCVFIHQGDYQSWQIEPGLLSIPELAIALGVKQEVAYHLINKGVIQTVNKGRLGRYVSERRVAQFNHLYSLPSRLAKTYATSPRYIIDLLSKRGVHPISGPSVDGGRQYIYRSSDVAVGLPQQGIY